MSAEDLTAEARQYAWGGATCKCPTGACPHRRASAITLADRNQLLDALTQVQAQQVTAETQRNFAQADADRHLRNARYLGSLLERIARTLGANPLDFAELPALIDGLRTTTDQLRIKAADHAHALDRAEAGATLWKTRLVHESQRLRGHLDKARTTTARAEARAGAYCLAYDHLDAVTRTLVNAISVHAYSLDQPKAASLLDNLDTVRDALSRDLESYLAEPYDDITPDTRVDLTPAGLAITSQVETPKPPCQQGCDIGYHLQGCPHIGTQLGIAPDGSELAKGGIIRDSRPDRWTAGHAAASQPTADAAGRLPGCRCALTGPVLPEGSKVVEIHSECPWHGIEQPQQTTTTATAGASVPRVAREEVLQEDVLQRNLALESAHEELAQYRREIDHIRQRFLIGRAVEETFTVGELLAVFRDGPSVASPARLSERREGEVIHPTDILDRLTSSHRSEASRG